METKKTEMKAEQTEAAEPSESELLVQALIGVQQQLAGAAVVGQHMGGGLDQRGDLGPDQVELAVLDVGVAVGEVGTPGADGFDFPALQGQAGLEAVDQVVFVTGTLVQRDGAVCRLGLAPTHRDRRGRGSG